MPSSSKSKTYVIAHKEAYALWTALEAEFARYHEAVRYIPDESLRLQDDLRRYLCLRCAGFLERLVFECLTKYLEAKASGPTVEFAKSFFSKAPNLNAKSFRRLMERLGSDHALRFDDFLTPTLKESLNDLHSIRNPIAHGNAPGGMKLDPERYRRLCQAAYEWLTSELLSTASTSTHYADTPKQTRS